MRSPSECLRFSNVAAATQSKKKYDRAIMFFESLGTTKEDQLRLPVRSAATLAKLMGMEDQSTWLCGTDAGGATVPCGDVAEPRISSCVSKVGLTGADPRPGLFDKGSICCCCCCCCNCCFCCMSCCHGGAMELGEALEPGADILAPRRKAECIGLEVEAVVESTKPADEKGLLPK